MGVQNHRGSGGWEYPSGVQEQSPGRAMWLFRIQTNCYTDFGPNNRHILLCGKWWDKSKFWATSKNRSVLKLKTTTTNHLEVFMRK